MPSYLQTVVTEDHATGDMYDMIVIQCECGFRFGLDGEYEYELLDTQFVCPICSREIIIDTSLLDG